jgi:hypothetical protein
MAQGWVSVVYQVDLGVQRVVILIRLRLAPRIHFLIMVLQYLNLLEMDLQPRTNAMIGLVVVVVVMVIARKVLLHRLVLLHLVVVVLGLGVMEFAHVLDHCAHDESP